MNDNEITTIAEGCDPERCTDRVGGEHAETCDVVEDRDAKYLADLARQPARSKTDPRWATSAWTDG